MKWLSTQNRRWMRNNTPLEKISLESWRAKAPNLIKLCKNEKLIKDKNWLLGKPSSVLTGDQKQLTHSLEVYWKLDARKMERKRKLTKRHPGQSSSSMQVWSLHSEPAADTSNPRGSMSLHNADGRSLTQGTCLVYLPKHSSWQNSTLDRCVRKGIWGWGRMETRLRKYVNFIVINELKYLELRKLYLNSKKIALVFRKRN